MNTEKEYIEPEVIKNGKSSGGFRQKATDFGKNYAGEKAAEQMGDIRKAAMVKGGMVLLPYILGMLLFLFVLFGLVFLIFAHPFDYIIAAVIAFFMIRGILSVTKMFSGKK